MPTFTVFLSIDAAPTPGQYSDLGAIGTVLPPARYVQLERDDLPNEPDEPRVRITGVEAASDAEARNRVADVLGCNPDDLDATSE